MPRTIASFAVASSLLLTAGLRAQDADRGSFLIRLGTDTLAAESFARSAGRLDGEIVRRQPSSTHWRYAVTFDAAGRPATFSLDLLSAARPQDLRGLRAVRVTFGADSARLEFTRDTVVRRAVAARYGVPSFPDFGSLSELWVEALTRSGADTAQVTLVSPLGGPAGTLKVYREASGRVVVPIIGGTVRLTLDGKGRVHTVDGTASTLKMIATRGDAIELGPLYARFAAFDAAGKSLGTFVSGRDTVTAEVGAAQLWIDYGRPARRGRPLFAAGVLGDTLWRTGANAATQFRTSRDLSINGRTLVAGTYSLWTHIDGDVAELVVNGQSGQWGTQYDRARDVFRVPMRLERAAGAPVETFTIDIVPAGTGRATLRLRWDDRVYLVPFAAREE